MASVKNELKDQLLAQNLKQLSNAALGVKLEL